MSIFFVCLTFSTAVPMIYAKNYCSMCKPPGSHTMCLYPNPGPGPNCHNYTTYEMRASDKVLILDLHNEFRSRVAVGSVINSAGRQPEAANMMELLWDDELQALAARWADQCVDHTTVVQNDKCKSTERFDVGQNIASRGGMENINFTHGIKNSVQEWFDEQEYFNPRWVSNFRGSPPTIAPRQIDHYTQLVWAKTKYVGCAAVSFVEKLYNKTAVVSKIVCNYGPAGNVVRASVYIQGKPCSKCPANTKCSSEYSGLCVSPGCECLRQRSVQLVPAFMLTLSSSAFSVFRWICNVGVLCCL